MFSLLFQNMKQNYFFMISENSLVPKNLSPKDKKDFFEFYQQIKPLFGKNKINLKEIKLLKKFSEEFNKLDFQDKEKIVLKNFAVAHFLKFQELKNYTKNNIKDCWTLFTTTFHKKFCKMEIDLSDLKPSLQQAGRYMLLNKHVQIKDIKKLLERIEISHFANLNGTYFSWNEMLELILKAKYNPKEYLLSLAKRTNWYGCQAIIDGILKMSIEKSKKLKKDKKFGDKLKCLQNELIKNDPNKKTYEYKLAFSKKDNIQYFEKIKFIYHLFDLPKEIKFSNTFSSIFTPKSNDIKYDTTQVDENYFLNFKPFMQLSYENFLKWTNKEKKQIFFIDNNNSDLKKINNLFYKWLNEKDVDLSGYLALLILKETCCLILPEVKNFKESNFYNNARLVAKKVNTNKVKWTTEILFANTSYFFEARNNICHFDKNQHWINYAIVALAVEYIKYFLKKTKVKNPI